jgi:hypothetical protein
MDNLILFHDGCHKIYYADRRDIATTSQMKEYGYDIIDGIFGNNLRELWGASCPLRFVNPADLDSGKPEIEQGNDDADCLDWFIADLREYYGVAGDERAK